MITPALLFAAMTLALAAGFEKGQSPKFSPTHGGEFDGEAIVARWTSTSP